MHHRVYIYVHSLFARDSEIPGNYDPSAAAVLCAEYVDTAVAATKAADRVFVMKLGRYDVIGQ